MFRNMFFALGLKLDAFSPVNYYFGKFIVIVNDVNEVLISHPNTVF